MTTMHKIIYEQEFCNGIWSRKVNLPWAYQLDNEQVLVILKQICPTVVSATLIQTYELTEDIL